MNAQNFFSVHDQSDERSSSDFHAFMFRLLCLHQTFLRSCPDFRVFMSRTLCVHAQTFVRSPDFVRSHSDFRAFMSRLSCVYQTFVRSFSNFRAFLMFSDYVILNTRPPLVRSSSVWTYLLPSGTSTWEYF